MPRARLRASARAAGRLVRRSHQRRAGGAGGVRRDRGARSRSTGRQPPLLRPDRATAASRHRRGQGPAAGTAPAQAPVAVPRARSAGHRRRRRRHLRRPGLGGTDPSDRSTRAGRRCARSSSRRASSFPSRSRACAATASSCARRSSCSRRHPSHRYPWRSSHRSIRWSGTEACSGPCSASTTCGSSSSRRPSGSGWYVLPILFSRPLVAGSNPDARDKACAVSQPLWEQLRPGRVEGFVDAMDAALRAYLKFARVSRLEWPPHLSMERRLFLTRP